MAAPAKPAEKLVADAETTDVGGQQAAQQAGQLQLEKIMRGDGRVVSLTAQARDISDAVLLVLLGQRHFRASDSVTGYEIMNGLRQSGHAVPRADRVLANLRTSGDVIILGNDAAAYEAQLSGSRVTLTTGDSRLSIAIGSAGLTLDFADGDRTLRYDPQQDAVLIGEAVITTSLSPLEAAMAAANFSAA